MPFKFSETNYYRKKTLRNFNLHALTFTLICISCLVVLSLIRGQEYLTPGKISLEHRDLIDTSKTKNCRLVHHAADKCAFIKANCADAEAGLFSYLSLYYCNLRKAQILAFAILSIWLALLFTTIGIAASDFFCINLSTIASILGMSESVAGTTFLAFGNGSPDVFSTFAAMNSKSGNLAVGELIGAASFITAVVAGSMALVREFRVGKKNLVRDVGFFIVAASLTIMFLADGLLSLWECCVMVGYYLFYVMIIVVWHWHRGGRGKKRESDAATRGHYVAMANEELLNHQTDAHDEDAPGGGLNRRDMEDFNLLERSSFPAIITYDDDEENQETSHGIRLAAEVTSNMRVTRPTISRRSTITPIRPSLVGALEFRSALASYSQRSRRENARLTYRGRSSEVALMEDSTEGEINVIGDTTLIPGVTQSRDRAAPFENGFFENASEARAIMNTRTSVSEAIDQVSISPKNLEKPIIPRVNQQSTSRYSSPQISPRTRSRNSFPLILHQRMTSESSALIEDGLPGVKFLTTSIKKCQASTDFISDSSRLISQKTQQPQLHIPSRNSSRSRLSSVSTFPAYFEPSYGVSDNSSQGPKSPNSILPHVERAADSNSPANGISFYERILSFWPSKYLPSPHKIGRTLFPTFCTWSQKTMWDKFVSIISAPSIFLLAITLPVVDSDSSDDLDDQAELNLYHESNTASHLTSQMGLPRNTPIEGQAEWLAFRRSVDGPVIPSLLHQTLESHPNIINEGLDRSPFRPSFNLNGSILNTESELGCAPLEDWDRWLVSIQIFTAPIFVLFILWANNADASLHKLTQMISYSIIGSIIAYLVLVLTTSSNQIPKYRFVLCFFGFVVAIAWISTIASEVVGVLKAIGIILEISDAILGLTIFAVGNSLGDLVADITMARLGYPVMALSACFGGPMLNILLGIGLSGIYMTVSEANKKHNHNPADRIIYKPYEIEVSRNLMISAFTLLVSLAGILISLPLNKWVMNKRIGWGLITLWSISNTLNLFLEVSGLWN